MQLWVIRALTIICALSAIAYIGWLIISIIMVKENQIIIIWIIRGIAIIYIVGIVACIGYLISKW